MSFEVLPYSKQNLLSCFKNQAKAPEEVILNKQHINCFVNYLTHIGVSTIVIEKEYVNRDFLEDYSSYYVRSFTPYERNCQRLHFFTNSFTQNDLKSILRGSPEECTSESLQKNYKGFIVLKPLPTTIIGKTCLATYPSENKRFFPSIREYKANLFGIPLKVESLAYQEQDSIVSACASSSIWTAFHGTAMLFQHALPSPVEITKWATKYFPFTNRHFPNKGLTGEQMAIAIREVGLEPYLYDVRNHDVFKATIYAYLKGGIPIVLGFDLWEQSGSNLNHRGKHAVTITGYGIDNQIKETFHGINLKLTSSSINKIYVHDDQIGPFARMEFKQNSISLNNQSFECIETTWQNSERKEGFIKATSDIIIIPLYHKIRIPYESVLQSIVNFNGIFNNWPIPNFELFEWDIFLSDIVKFKNDIFKSTEIAAEQKSHILTKKLPKYLWRAKAKGKEGLKMEFLFDATDIDQGSFYLMRVTYDTSVEIQYRFLVENIDLNHIRNLTAREIINDFK